jgi:hypothetical protein
LYISPQFHVVFDDLFTTVISQPESDTSTLAWADLCITSRYQTEFDEHDPVRLDDDWLSTDELALRRYLDAQNNVIPPPPLVTPTLVPIAALQPPPKAPPIPVAPPIPFPVVPVLDVPLPQRELPLSALQRESIPVSTPSQPKAKSVPKPAVRLVLPTVPSPTSTDLTSRSGRQRKRPVKFASFDVSYGALSAVDAFFAALPDSLRDPFAQTEYEIDNLERQLTELVTAGTLPTIAAFVASKSDPDTLMYHEAMMDSDKEAFREAMEVEIMGLETQKTWELVLRTTAMARNKKVLPTTWTFRRKRYPDGRIRKHKARFCVRGDKQVVGVDVFETYAPVVQWTTVRLCFILSTILGLSSRQVDYTNAFVQAPVKDEMYVEAPKGFDLPTDGDYVLKLKKNLYGSRDAPLAWFETLKASLESRNFVPSDIDPCLFIHKDMIVVCFVDDLIYLGRDILKIDAMIKDLGSEFALTVEDMSSFLGIQIDIRDDHSMVLTQRGLTQRILEACHMVDCNVKDTPATTTTVGTDATGAPFSGDFSYASVVGMLMYLASNSRPDISFAVHQCARFTHSPRASHGIAVQRICRYLKGTIDNGLILRPSPELRLDAHSDSDFAGLWKQEDDQDPVCVKSRTGFVITLATCPLMWHSKLQGQVALSTMEAEYIALSTTLRSLLPLKELVSELAASLLADPTFITTTHSTVFEDNNGALSLATSPKMTPRSKHIAVPYHFFREHVTRGTIQIHKVASEVNTADIFTKGLVAVKFRALRLLLMGW